MNGLGPGIQRPIAQRIVWIALMVGQLIFLVMMLSGLIAPEHQSQPMLGYIALVYLATVVPITFAVRAILRRRGGNGSKPAAVGNIIFWAGCESACYQGMIFALVTSWSWPMIVCVIVPILLQVLTFPL